MFVVSSRSLKGSSSGDDGAKAVAVGSDGSLYAVGTVDESSGGKNIWLARYSPALVLLSSVTIDGSDDADDGGAGIAVDASGNVYAAGFVHQGGSDNLWVGKFDAALNLLASATPSLGFSHANAVAVDSSGVVATGFVSPTLNADLWIGRFDLNLNLLSSATFDVGMQENNGVGLALRSGAAYVAGYTAQFSFVNRDFWVGRFDAGLNLASSATIVGSGGQNDEAHGVAVDGSGRVYAGGFVNDGAQRAFLARFSPDLVLQASATSAAFTPSEFNAVALDANGNVLVAGNTNENSGGAAAWIGEFTQDLALVSSAAFSGPASGPDQANGLAASGSALFIAGQLSTSSQGLDAWLASAPLTPGASASLAPGEGRVITLQAPYGQITVSIPAGAFTQAVTVSLGLPSAFAPPVSPAGTLVASGVGFRVTLDKPLVPGARVPLAVSYRPSDVLGLTESRLILARSDSGGPWVALPTSIDAASHRASASTDRFSDFQLMQTGGADVSDPRVYPNPFRPNRGQAKVNVANLPPFARVRVYTLAGELLKDLSADASGSAAWDGRNDGGRAVASGVYLLLIQSDGDKNVTKLVIER